MKKEILRREIGEFQSLGNIQVRKSNDYETIIFQ